MQEIVRNANAFANEPDPEPLPQITFDENEPPKALPIIKTEPTLQENLTEAEENDVVTELVKVKDEVVPDPEPIRLDFPEQTGIRSVDERNYQEWVDTLEIMRPNLFIDEDDNYTDEPQVNVLVPTDIVDGLPNDPIDVIAQPKVETIVPPPPFIDQPKIEAPPFFDPNEGRTFVPPSPEYVDSDSDIDFEISKPVPDYDSDVEFVTSKPGDGFIKSEPDSDDDDSDNESDEESSDGGSDIEYIEDIVKPDPADGNKIIQLPIQFDTDKIILIDDGDMKMIEPENIQVEEKSLVPLSNGTIALPQPQEMEVVRMRSLVLLKRKFKKNDDPNLQILK